MNISDHIKEEVKLAYGLTYINCSVEDHEDGTISVWVRDEDNSFGVDLDLNDPRYMDILLSTIDYKLFNS